MSDDFKIIQAVLAGDREAYADLVRAYQVQVRTLCRSFLLDPAEAEDAAQEAFLKAFIALPRYRQETSFLAWVYRIASNHCLDLLRKRKRHKTDSLDNLMDQKGDSGMWASLYGTALEATDEGSQDKEERSRLAMQLLSILSEEQRQILVLRELDGLSYEEIGSVLHCSLDGVKARLHRARQKLQEKARHFLDQNSLIK